MLPRWPGTAFAQKPQRLGGRNARTARARFCIALSSIVVTREDQKARAGLLLVIDDDHLAGRRLRLLLEGAGFEVSTSSDGVVTLGRLKVLNRRPNLILINLAMRLIEGVELMSHLRCHPQWSSIPIVVLSTRQIPEVPGTVGQIHRDASDEDILSVVLRFVDDSAAITRGQRPKHG